ncbi:MAG TPA: AAA family ATPase [Methanobacterium sp.]
MTARKKESALGRGLDALIRTDLTDEKKSEDETENKEVSKTSTSGSRRKKNTNGSTTKSNSSEAKNKKSKDLKSEEKKGIQNTVDQTLVENVILEVRKNPRISLWSAKSAAVLRLLKKTKPEFSISKEASALIEEAVKDKYPELWEEFEDREI